MARTLGEIYDEIVAEKQSMSTLTGLQPVIDNSQTLLNGLTTNSKVAVWRLVFWVIAFGIWIHEQLWDAFRAEIELIRNEAIVGGAAWLQAEALKFQYGDPLVMVNNTYKYETLDATKQIVKRCSVSDSVNMTIVKVAKLNGTVPEALSNSELAAFTHYMLYYRRFAGVSMRVISQDADLLRLDYDIYYDPLYELSVIKSSITTAVNNYLQNIPFNGIFYATRQTDALQAVAGVTDVVCNGVQTKATGLDYAVVSRLYNPQSGYLKIDSAFDVSSHFNYIAYV